jgi:hypothetical protein
MNYPYLSDFFVRLWSDLLSVFVLRLEGSSIDESMRYGIKPTTLAYRLKKMGIKRPN